MLTTVTAGPYTLRGVSLGGVYTSLACPELGVLFDAGIPARSLAALDTIMLSHGHVDHIGALPAILGIRALQGKARPPRVIMPAEIVDDLTAALAALTKLQRWPLEIEAIGMRAGEQCELRGDLRVRAVQTFHPVPSLAYVISRRISKLRPEFHDLPGPEIAARRRAGEAMLMHEERAELAYVTDTLISAFDHGPELFDARVLVMECTFLDDRKSLEGARSGCHIHLDEVIERAEQFRNETIVMMHVSQLYRPDEVAHILDVRVPAALRRRIVPFVPQAGPWPG
ncbi:MAG: MBL fold metallo-hydrolase [Kofleriaceae bacterium]